MEGGHQRRGGEDVQLGEGGGACQLVLRRPLSARVCGGHTAAHSASIVITPFRKTITVIGHFSNYHFNWILKIKNNCKTEN